MLVHPDINPIAFSIGPLAVRWYGLMYLAGFGFAWWLGTRRIAQGQFDGHLVLVDNPPYHPRGDMDLDAVADADRPRARRDRAATGAR